MKEYTLDGMKYGIDPRFWKWFYLGKYMENYFLCNPKRTKKDFLDKLKRDLAALNVPENLDEKSALAQIEGLREAITALETEE